MCVFAILQLGMLDYFLVAATIAPRPLFIITVIFYVFITAINLIAPFVDPGTLPKTLFGY